MTISFCVLFCDCHRENKNAITLPLDRNFRFRNDWYFISLLKRSNIFLQIKQRSRMLIELVVYEGFWKVIFALAWFFQRNVTKSALKG